MSDKFSPKAFELPIPINPADIDVHGHVNNVVYVRWVQDAAVSHWRALATKEQQANVSWVVVRHEIDYKRPARAHGLELQPTPPSNVSPKSSGPRTAKYSHPHARYGVRSTQRRGSRCGWVRIYGNGFRYRIKIPRLSCRIPPEPYTGFISPAHSRMYIRRPVK